MYLLFISFTYLIKMDDKVLSNVIKFVYDDYTETKRFHLLNADAAKQQ